MLIPALLVNSSQASKAGRFVPVPFKRVFPLIISSARLVFITKLNFKVIRPDVGRPMVTDVAVVKLPVVYGFVHVGKFDTRVRTCPFVPAGTLTSSFAAFVRTSVEIVRPGIVTTPVSEIENLDVPDPATILLIRNSWEVPFAWPIDHSHTPPLFDKWYLACPATGADIDIWPNVVVPPEPTVILRVAAP